MISFLRVSFECFNIILSKRFYSFSKLCKEFSSAFTLSEHDAKIIELNFIILLLELQNRLSDELKLNTIESIKVVRFVDQRIKSLMTWDRISLHFISWRFKNLCYLFSMLLSSHYTWIYSINSWKQFISFDKKLWFNNLNRCRSRNQRLFWIELRRQ